MPTILGRALNSDFSGTTEMSDDKVVTRYGLVFNVLADNDSQGPATIRATPGLPLVGLSSYSYNGEIDLLAICKRKVPRKSKKSRRLWHVACDYDTTPSNNQENEQDQQEPENRAPILSWDAEFGDEVLYQDYSDPPVDCLNPNGQPYDPPLTTRVIYPVLQIERWQTTFLPSTIHDYLDHTNVSDFYGASPGHALMSRIAANQVEEEGRSLWKTIHRIRFSRKGYRARPLNQGTLYSTVPFTGDDSTLEPFLRDDVPYIGNLKADGTKAGPSERTYGDFKDHPEAEFDDLNLQ